VYLNVSYDMVAYGERSFVVIGDHMVWCVTWKFLLMFHNECVPMLHYYDSTAIND